MAEDGNNSDAEKTEEPSQHRIDEFRKRGEVASSRELTSVLVLASAFMTLILSTAYIYETLASFIDWLYSLDFAKAYEDKQFSIVVHRSLTTMLLCAAPVCFITLCSSIISNVAQFGFLYSPEVLSLKWDRVNPVSGFKRLFSIRSVVEALKGIFKFLVIFFIVYIFMKDEITTFTGYLHMDYSQGFAYGREIATKVIFFILIGLLVIALFDLSYQKFSYYNKMKMTKEEAKRERKEHEGNPEIKQRIRNIQKEMSKKRMMEDVPKSDVVVTNPTHVSVALKYDAESMISPKVIAKGVDSIALTIRKIAKEHDVPIVENVPLARSLYKTVKIGGFIPHELYKAVSEVISFVYRLKRKNIKKLRELNERNI